MLGDSSSAALGSSSGDAPPPVPSSSAAAASVHHHDGSSEEDRMKLGGGGGGGGGGGDEFGDRSYGGNRWPRQETIALLKIRSDMDVVFRDASVKGPLWEEVSRKLADLGYQRSAKKCKEKFENVYKYHKRTKEGRTGKADGKTYRFFDQLRALESQPSSTTFAPPPPPPPQPSTTVSVQPKTQSQAPAVMAAPPLTTVSHIHQINSSATNINNVTVPSVSNNTTTTTNVFQTPFKPHASPAPTNPTILPTITANPTAVMSGDMLMSNSTSSSSSTDVDEEMAEEGDGEGEGEGGRRKRKRKWKDFFERLMKEVIQRQEDLQKRFLEAIERREQERIAREETWRIQEMTRINREREILAQERSVAAAKDAAVMAFLQKISDQQPPQSTNKTVSPSTLPVLNLQPPAVVPPPPPPTPIAMAVQVPAPAPSPAAPVATPKTKLAPQSNNTNSVTDEGNAGIVHTSGSMASGGSSASSSRWPKTEVHDLIKLRTSMDEKYQENGPKGPLWEEISAAMRRIGYNRSAKRCKEKWENINKYFKKVKESNKRRPEDSKTCPYFNQLDAIYREKTKAGGGVGEINNVPLMVQPEQQWPPMAPTPLLQRQEGQNESSAAAPGESNRPVLEDDEDDIDEDEDEEDEEDEEGGNNYELVASKPNSVGATE